MMWTLALVNSGAWLSYPLVSLVGFRLGFLGELGVRPLYSAAIYHVFLCARFPCSLFSHLHLDPLVTTLPDLLCLMPSVNSMFTDWEWRAPLFLLDTTDNFTSLRTRSLNYSSCLHWMLLCLVFQCWVLPYPIAFCWRVVVLCLEMETLERKQV